MNKFFFILLVAILVVIGFLISKAADKNKPIACTMEAKVCPNGSTVGRIGPNCEFAVCPADLSAIALPDQQAGLKAAATLVSTTDRFAWPAGWMPAKRWLNKFLSQG